MTASDVFATNPAICLNGDNRMTVAIANDACSKTPNVTAERAPKFGTKHAQH